MERIVLIEPFPIAGIQQLEKQFLIRRVSQASELQALLGQQEIKAVFCPVRFFHPRFSQWILSLPCPLQLVLVGTRLDKMDERIQDPIFYWKEPYSFSALHAFFQHTNIQQATELERIHVMERRRLQVIRVSDILLLKKMPPDQVLIHTKEGDYQINANLSTIEAMFPENSITRISDQLMVPTNAKHQITQKGLVFHGGFIPIRNRYLHSRKGVVVNTRHTNIIQEQSF